MGFCSNPVKLWDVCHCKVRGANCSGGGGLFKHGTPVEPCVPYVCVVLRSPNRSHDCRKAFSPLSQGEPRTIARDPMGLNRGQVDCDVADGRVEGGIVGSEY